MLNLMLLVSMLSLVDFLSGSYLPEYIHRCFRNDPELNSCALKSARESLHKFSLGDDSRDLSPLDPLLVPQMTFYVPNEHGLKVVFTDNNFTGFSDMQLKSLKLDLKKKHVTADGLVSLLVRSQYDLSGRILILPVKSNGDANIIKYYIKLVNTTLRIKFWYEHNTQDDGRVHWQIVKHDLKYSVGRAYFHLGNLLQDKIIGEQVNKLLNDMWRDIVADVGPAIAASLSAAVTQNLGQLLQQVPYDELLPPE